MKLIKIVKIHLKVKDTEQIVMKPNRPEAEDGIRWQIVIVKADIQSNLKEINKKKLASLRSDKSFRKHI